MTLHGFLLQRHAGGEERRQEGRIAVLDCCDPEAMSFVATNQRHHRRGRARPHRRRAQVRTGQPLPVKIEWLTDNGSCYLARETRRFAEGVIQGGRRRSIP
jgi:putative transposase